MKSKWKYLGIILVAFLCWNMQVHAQTITVDKTKRGTVDPESYYVTNTSSIVVTDINYGIGYDDVLQAYKIMDFYYNEEKNILSYQFTDTFQTFITQTSDENIKKLTPDAYYQLTSGEITSGSTQTNSTLDNLVSKYATYLKKSKIEGRTMNESGSSRVLNNAEVGAYLILLKEGRYVYSVMVGNIEFVEENNEWVLKASSIHAKGSLPMVDKRICPLKDAGEQDFGECEYGNYQKLEDEYVYGIEVSVPQWPTNTLHKTLIIEDTMDKEITFLEFSKMKIVDGEEVISVTEDGKATNQSGKEVASIQMTSIEEGKTKITITWDTDNLMSPTVYVYYNAQLKKDTKTGKYENVAVLRYSVEPYSEEDVLGEDTLFSDVTLAGIKLFKYENQKGERKPLSGATFEIYQDETLQQKVGSITTGTDGYGTFDGIEEGTYYLKETKAPTGYTLNKATIALKCSELRVTSLEDNSFESYLDDNWYCNVEIPNTKMGALPFTGGAGTILFTVVGASIIGVATMIFLSYRKKKPIEE